MVYLYWIDIGLGLDSFFANSLDLLSLLNHDLLDTLIHVDVVESRDRISIKWTKECPSKIRIGGRAVLVEFRI